jgi:hypothetical protein
MFSRSTFLLFFTLCLLHISSAFKTEEVTKKWFQHCEVKMPDHLVLVENRGEDHLEGSEWVWNTFPAYCYPERLRVTMTYKDTKCISDAEDRIDYCNLTKLAYKLPDRANDLTYRCNVYNGTTGTFFYYGNVWPDYASC